MTAPLSRCFIGGWGSTQEVWRGVLSHEPVSQEPVSHENVPQTSPSGPHFLRWLDCVQDWPGTLAALSAMPQPFLLVGWSLGSVLALRAALDLPGQVAALVLVSATPCMCADTDHTGTHGGIDPRTLAAMRARAARNPGPVLEAFAQQCAAPDGDGETRQSYLRQATQFSPDELAVGLDALASLDVRQRLGEIIVPCSILHGACDRIVPLQSAQFLAARIPHAQLDVLQGRGHALPFTAPAEIAQCVEQCVEQCVSRCVARSLASVLP
jgi:pimeloyl-[acyl-carrier protein] methyl ester esterase